MSSTTKASSKLGDIIKSFDLFGEGVGFEIEGRATNTSYLGSLISLAIIVITFSYAASRFTVMSDYADTSHQTTTSQSEYSQENPLTYEQTNFNFALSLSDFS